MSYLLTSFIRTLYDDIIQYGRFEYSQAWDRTRKFVKQISIEQANVRIKAWDSIQDDNQWKTTAPFFFTALKSQEVMAEFIRLSIKDNPFPPP